MKNWLYILIVIASISLSACNNRLSSTYELEPFECVYILAFGESADITNIKAEVEFAQRNTYQMNIQKSSEDSIRWYTENNTLYVTVLSQKKPILSLTAPYYRSIQCINVSNIEINDTLKQSCLDFYSSGAANTNLKLDVDTLNLSMDAYNTVRICGHCDTASIQAQYSHPFAKFDAKDFQVSNMQIACGAAGTHTCLNVINHLWITDGLNSKIDYLGNPEIMQANIRFSILRGN